MFRISGETDANTVHNCKRNILVYLIYIRKRKIHVHTSPNHIHIDNAFKNKNTFISISNDNAFTNIDLFRVYPKTYANPVNNCQRKNHVHLIIAK